MYKNKNENNVEPIHTDYVSKKEKAMLRTYEEPILPKLCTIICRCMILLTICMILVDINAFIRYNAYLKISHLFSNISTTGFIAWLLFSCLLIPLSYGSIWQIKKRYWKRVNDTADANASVQTDDSKAQSKRALKRLTQPFIRYITVCFAGIIIFGIFFVVFHIR